MEAIKESIAQLSLAFNHRMDTFESECTKKISTAASTSTEIPAEFPAFKLFVLTPLRALQEQIEMLDKSVDNIEMRSRRKMLLFHGLPEVEKNEDVALTISKTVTEQLKIPDFSVSCISRCHRMGRSAGADKPRPILVKFSELRLREQIWSSKTKLKGSGTTLTEFLTKVRHDTFMTARERFGMAKCWTRDGVIYVVDAEGSRHRVTCLKELNEIPKPGSPTKTSAANKKVPRAAVKSKKGARR